MISVLLVGIELVAAEPAFLFGSVTRRPGRPAFTHLLARRLLRVCGRPERVCGERAVDERLFGGGDTCSGDVPTRGG